LASDSDEVTGGDILAASDTTETPTLFAAALGAPKLRIGFGLHNAGKRVRLTITLKRDGRTVRNAQLGLTLALPGRQPLHLKARAADRSDQRTALLPRLPDVIVPLVARAVTSTGSVSAVATVGRCVG
jgi:hypothetical protein